MTYDVIYFDGSMDKDVSARYLTRVKAGEVRAIFVSGQAGFPDGTLTRGDINAMCAEVK